MNQNREKFTTQAVETTESEGPSVREFHFGLSINVWKIIDALAQKERQPQDLTDAERRAILDTRHLDGMPRSLNLRRAISKWQIAGLNIDPDSGPRQYSSVGTVQARYFDWSVYIGHGENAQRQRIDYGKKSGITRRKKADERDKRIVAYARTLMGNIARGRWAHFAAKRFDVSVPTARKAIKSAGLYEKPSIAKRKKVVRKIAIRSGR